MRRIATLDLLRQGDPASLAALAAHLPHEPDEKTALLAVRGLAAAGAGSAIPTLANLRDRPETPIRLHHAAMIAHDRLERLNQQRP